MDIEGEYGKWEGKLEEWLSYKLFTNASGGVFVSQRSAQALLIMTRHVKVSCQGRMSCETHPCGPP